MVEEVTEVDVTKTPQLPKPEFDEDRLRSLRTAVEKTQKKVDEILVGHQTEEMQKDHLFDVEQNSREILRDLLGREISEGEGLQLKLAVLLHDVGKWEDGEKIRKIYYEKPDLVASLGLSEDEKGILSKGIVGMRFDVNKYHWRDIAHHLLSTLIVANEAQEDGVLSDLDPRDLEIVQKAVIEHQFEGYYRRRAMLENVANPQVVYTQAQIDAIRRMPQLSAEELGKLTSQDLEVLISIALRDGDLLSMCEVGRVDEEGEAHHGGYAKLTGIVTEFRLKGFDQGSGGDFFDSPDKSVKKVGDELISPKARELYKSRTADIGRFKQILGAAGFAEDIHPVEGYHMWGNSEEENSARARVGEILRQKEGEIKKAIMQIVAEKN